MNNEYLNSIKLNAFINELEKIANMNASVESGTSVQSYIQPLLDIRSGGPNNALTDKRRFGATNNPVSNNGTSESLPTQLESGG